MMTDPFLKWPGGKRWLVSRKANLFPKNFERYFEPFLGSGAVFFSMVPAVSILSDANAELVNTYRCVAREPELIEAILEQYQAVHSDVMYYKVRDENPMGELERAARFIYLNRTCFNGMYRVNQKGTFNVPIGTKQSVAFPKGYLLNVASILKGASFLPCDFETAMEFAHEDDFIFVDPPYTVMHNNNGFVKYNAKIFSWKDQVRLSLAVKRAAKRGAKILLTNADHCDVRDLYADFGKQLQVSRASILAGIPEGRRDTTELIITNY